jgi:hypothetical protein
MKLKKVCEHGNQKHQCKQCCKYVIGDNVFPTKTACVKYTREIINNLGECIIDKNHVQFKYFTNLINNHPRCNEKIGTGIEYFYIETNILNKSAYQSMIKRCDGTCIDFSWVLCSSFRDKYPMENLTASMRRAISHVTIKYKKESELICKLCLSTSEEYCNYHVDHDIISFSQLKTDFLKSTTKQIPTEFGNCKEYNLTAFNAEDIEFETEWVNYHNAHCSFQILCKTCNLTKPKN